MSRVAIDVVSDVVCPWCYVGKRRLEGALGRLDGIEADVRWRPFQLDSTIPPEDHPREAYMIGKFGSREAYRRMYEAVAAAGREERIPFAFDRIAVSPNTLDAHRLIRWAGGRSAAVQEALVEALFRSFFVEGENIGDKSVLVRLGGEAGLDNEILKTLLDGDDDRDAVAAEIGQAQAMGVSGVPTFVLAGRYAVQGAQPADLLAKAIAEAAARAAEGDQAA